MKKILVLLGLVAAFTAFSVAKADEASENAEFVTLFPNAFITGSTIQVSVYNHTDLNLSCDGSLFVFTRNGGTSVWVNMPFVQPRSTSFTTAFIPGGDEAVSVSTSPLNCWSR